METKIFTDSIDDIIEAAEIIRRGGLVAFPTETVYGLGADALNPEAVAKVYAAKGRPQDNPMIVHIADPEDIFKLMAGQCDSAGSSNVASGKDGAGSSNVASGKDGAGASNVACGKDGAGASNVAAGKDGAGASNVAAIKKLAAAFWPGPLTMVVRRNPCVPDVTTGGLDTVGVRLPDSDTARRLIRGAGCPIAAPSANLSGRPSPTEAGHVINDMDGRIDAIIKGPDCRVGVESTVVDMTGEIPVVLRPGAVTPEMIGAVLGTDVMIDPAVYKRIKSLTAEDGSSVSDPELSLDTNQDQNLDPASNQNSDLDKNLISDPNQYPEPDKNLNSDPNQYPEPERPKSPGMKYKHYAPRGEMWIYRGEPSSVKSAIKKDAEEMERAGKKVMVLAFGGDAPEEAARKLFASLRDADSEAADVILAEAIPDTGVGLAVMDRMLRAAGFKVKDV